VLVLDQIRQQKEAGTGQAEGEGQPAEPVA